LGAILSILAAGGAFAQAPTTSAKPAGKNAAKTLPAETGSAAAAAPGPALALGEYLQQVSTKHEGYKAAQQTARGARDQAGEGSLIYSPQLSANVSEMSDSLSNPFSSDDKLHMRNYTLGVGQQTNFGLSGKLGFNRIELDVPNVGDYQSTWLSLDLSQSLWRNWAGRETRAQSEAATSKALATALGQGYASQQILLEAETTYWRLALARERVQMVREAVARADRLFSWAKRRVDLHLADRADLLQASTNLQSQKLELKRAEDDERSAAQSFNSSRGLNSDVVNEKLVSLSPELIASMNAPERKHQRDDVKAAEYQAKAASASSTLAAERNTPNLEVYGSLPLSQPDSSGSAALANSLPATSRPFTTIGLKFSAPLDFGTQSNVRQGYKVEAEAADLTYQRKTFEAERDWADLVAKFRQAKERLTLVSELEKSQKSKLDYERQRHESGRSTTQQVLLFEADFDQAQLGRLQTLAEVLNLNAQMKLYGVSYESR
jgi:outer membrane protein TolC